MHYPTISILLFPLSCRDYGKANHGPLRAAQEANDLGQILEGLRIREESWRNTAIYLRDGYFPDDTFVCEECSDEQEAENIANFYQRIILNLEQQRDKDSQTAADQDASGQLNESKP